MNTATTYNAPDALIPVILKAALHKINECRAKCPGIGGDIDATNLQHMIQEVAPYLPGHGGQHATLQALTTLKNLSESLDIDAANEIAALQWLSGFSQ